jgi:acetate kinase
MSFILVINCGSSSLKFSIIDPENGTPQIQGLAERLNTPQATLKSKFLEGVNYEVELPNAKHTDVLDEILREMGDIKIVGVGHRVVHGGEAFKESVKVDPNVVRGIDECIELAPLHNPANLTGIRAAMQRFPDVPHVAVFDTAFHQTMPPRAYLYAIPYRFYEGLKVRRYGFHGTSHGFVAGQAAKVLGKPLETLHLITAHLGNGCSACAIKEGHSVDTTMGLTPLEGLVMGTRSGDVDPNLHDYLSRRIDYDLAGITNILNRESGLLGISGLSNDMRTLVQAINDGNARADLAVDVFCYRLAKAILGLSASLDRLDALVFTEILVFSELRLTRSSTRKTVRPLAGGSPLKIPDCSRSSSPPTKNSSSRARRHAFSNSTPKFQCLTRFISLPAEPKSGLPPSLSGWCVRSTTAACASLFANLSGSRQLTPPDPSVPHILSALRRACGPHFPFPWRKPNG